MQAATRTSGKRAIAAASFSSAGAVTANEAPSARSESASAPALRMMEQMRACAYCAGGWVTSGNRRQRPIGNWSRAAVCRCDSQRAHLEVDGRVAVG